MATNHEGGHSHSGGRHALFDFLFPLCLLLVALLPRGVRASVAACPTGGRGLLVRFSPRVNRLTLRIEMPGLSVLGSGELVL